MTLNQAIISETTLSVNTSSITIPVPSGYTDIRLVMSARGTATPSGITYEHIRLQFNGGGSYYKSKMLYANGSSANSADDSGGGSTYAPWAGVYAASNTTSNTFSNCEIYVPNYGVSGSQKTFSGDSITETNASTGPATTIQAMLWSGTDPITSIVVFPNTGNFVAGSSFTLYGISKLGVTPTVYPKATGGDIIKNDGTYWYHAFLSSGAFAPQQSLSADVLVVAGGGSGGSGNGHIGGGGGAGGVVYLSNQAFTATPNTVTVGAGAAGRNSAGGGAGGGSGYQGSNSSIASLTAAIGGGYGASGAAAPTGIAGGPGGSGGGGSHWDYSGFVAGGTATSGQGNAGGNTTGYGAGRSGGGGGGAGAAGGNGDGNVGAAGGAGTNAYSSILSAVSLGVSGYIAGGGGGGSDGQPQNFAGGAGGGGTGYYSGTNGGNGVANTGSGGGAAQYMTSGAGGSGVVIIRYAMA
jgi:hypothetical protein